MLWFEVVFPHLFSIFFKIVALKFKHAQYGQKIRTDDTLHCISRDCAASQDNLTLRDASK